MSRHDDHESAYPSAFLPPKSSKERRKERRKRQRLDALAATSSGRAISDWSPSPQPLLEQATERYLEFVASYRNCDDIGQDLVTASTQRSFQPELIRAEITKVMESIPFYEDQGAYTSRNPHICWVRNLIRTRAVGCTLCAFYERGPIIETQAQKLFTSKGGWRSAPLTRDVSALPSMRWWTGSSMHSLPIPTYAMLANGIPRRNGFKIR